MQSKMRGGHLMSHWHNDLVECSQVFRITHFTLYRTQKDDLIKSMHSYTYPFPRNVDVETFSWTAPHMVKVIVDIHREEESIIPTVDRNVEYAV
jgi:hypothetical protein